MKNICFILAIIVIICSCITKKDEKTNRSISNVAKVKTKKVEVENEETIPVKEEEEQLKDKICFSKLWEIDVDVFFSGTYSLGRYFYPDHNSLYGLTGEITNCYLAIDKFNNLGISIELFRDTSVLIIRYEDDSTKTIELGQWEYEESYFIDNSHFLLSLEKVSSHNRKIILINVLNGKKDATVPIPDDAEIVVTPDNIFLVTDTLVNRLDKQTLGCDSTYTLDGEMIGAYKDNTLLYIDGSINICNNFTKEVSWKVDSCKKIFKLSNDLLITEEISENHKLRAFNLRTGNLKWVSKTFYGFESATLGEKYLSCQSEPDSWNIISLETGERVDIKGKILAGETKDDMICIDHKDKEGNSFISVAKLGDLDNPILRFPVGFDIVKESEGAETTEYDADSEINQCATYSSAIFVDGNEAIVLAVEYQQKLYGIKVEQCFESIEEKLDCSFFTD